MGYCAYPFGVDIEKIKQVFGSKDEKLYNEVMSDSYFVNYNEQDNIEGELQDIVFKYVPPNLRKPTKAKLFGLISSQDGSGLYGEWNEYFYVLLSICSVLGKDFSPKGDHFYWGENWKKIDELLRTNGSEFNLDKMTRNVRIFDTPFKDGDLCSNIYIRNEIPEFYSDFIEIEKMLDKNDDELIDFYTEFREVLLYCKENKLDIITFFC